jgi:hypothetical protein
MNVMTPKTATLEPRMTIRTTIRTRPATKSAAKLPTVARFGIPLALAVLVMAANAGVAGAADKRLGIAFKGPGEGATRNMVSKIAKSKKYQVVGAQAIAKAAGRLHATLDENDTAGFTAVAKELGISAYLIGEVSKKKATLTVRGGADGTVSAEGTWAGPNPRKLSQAVGKTFWKRLGGAIEGAKAPSGAKAPVVAEEAPAPETGADEPGDDEPKAAKKPVAAASDDSSSGESSERSRKSSKSKKKSSDDEAGSETTVTEHADTGDEGAGPAGQGLILSVGPRFISRSLTYVQDIYHRNSKYSLGVAPEVGLNADIYPGALLGAGGIASDIGLTVDLSYMLPVVTSASKTGTGHYTTYSLNWSVGAKVRLPFGLFATVAYGDQRFQLQKVGNATGIDVPMVDYRYVRAGAGARVNLTPDVALMANAGYLQCLSLGQIAQAGYYTKATCAAFEAGAGVGIRLSAMFELQGGASIRRYGLSFHQKPSDFAADINVQGARVAGGAVDQYLFGYVALAGVLGGGDSGGGGAKEEAPAGDEEAESPKKAKDKDKDESGDEDDDGK